MVCQDTLPRFSANFEVQAANLIDTHDLVYYAMDGSRRLAMRMPNLFFAMLLCLLAFPHTSRAADGIVVTVEGHPTTTLDAAMLATWPREKVSAGAHDDAPSIWEGVALVEVLRRQGAPVGEKLRGGALASVVRITAKDGYQVVFSLSELDSAFGKTVAILVDMQDGKPLGAAGPFRLVVPGDSRAGRWPRNVVRIEVLSIAAPRT